MNTNEWLKQAMRERGISKRQLSKTTGISYSTLTRILNEPNTGNMRTWKIICDALGCDLFIEHIFVQDNPIQQEDKEN